jgi:hypothetical protein
MSDPNELAQLFDEWEKNLPAAERAACRRALRNVTARLEKVGAASAKELLIAVLMYLAARRPAQKPRRVPAPQV